MYFLEEIECPPTVLRKFVAAGPAQTQKNVVPMCNVPTNVHPKKLKVEANKHDKQTANSVEGDLHLEFDELSLFVLVLGRLFEHV